MRINDIKEILQDIKKVNFILPNGISVPPHFHITEIGIITKHFIDCGGTERTEKVANFQLWTADDFDHRIAPKKLLDIIELSEDIIGLNNLEIEVEYQTDTIGKFGLKLDRDNFLLTNTKTDCLDKDKCGITDKEDSSEKSTCNTKAGCC